MRVEREGGSVWWECKVDHKLGLVIGRVNWRNKVTYKTILGVAPHDWVESNASQMKS